MAESSKHSNNSNMEVSTIKYNSILKCLDESHKNKTYEFEIKFTKIDQSSFNYLMKYLLSKTQQDKEYLQSIENSLDISLSSSQNDYRRLTINGLEAISKYCKNQNNLSNYTIINKLPIQFINVNDYDFRINVKNESPMASSDEESEFLAQLTSFEKKYRSKKRYSFLTNNSMFRIDMTIVRESIGNTVINSNLFNKYNSYEVEIEYLQSETFSKKTHSVELFNLITMTWKVLNDTDYIISNKKKIILSHQMVNLIQPKILQSYTKQDKDKTKSDDMFGDNIYLKYFYNAIRNDPQKFFLSYQPATLQLRHLNKSSTHGDISILTEDTEYCVTDKADGERHLLYIDVNNHVYMINNRFNVVDTGLYHKDANTIIDGEYVKYNNRNQMINKFMCFDIYFHNNKDVRHLPLLQNKDNKQLVSRINILKEFEKSAKKNKQIDIQVKTFLSVKNNYDLLETGEYYNIHDENKHPLLYLSKLILDNGSIDYHIDGLIFTPVNFSVGAIYEDEKVNYGDYKRLKQNWIKVLKWKPPEESTIDMLVKFKCNNFVTRNNIKYVICDLLVSGKKHNFVDPIDTLGKLQLPLQKHEEENAELLFVTCHLPINENHKNPQTKLCEFIHSNTIVEFSYDKFEDNPMLKWIPNRIRFDKTQLYHGKNNMKKNIKGAANHINVAEDVMYSINNPVTENIFRKSILDVNFDNIPIQNVDKYYERQHSRNRLLMLNMNKFHNWIKDTLYKLFSQKYSSLLEIACGKGGDLNKWYNTSFKLIVGLDNNVDNILNNQDGAYQRLLNKAQFTHGINKKHMNIIYSQIDATQKWSDSYVSKIENDDLRVVNKLLWGTLGNESSKFSKNVKVNFHKVMKHKFQIVSCQFAIHYFFENEQSIDNFCYNLNNSMIPGGFFFGTAMNGYNVIKLLKERKGYASGYHDIHKTTIWSIKQLYNDSEINTEDDNVNIGLGKEIEVYVESIGQVITEFLFDIEILEKKLAKYKILLVKEPKKDLNFDFAQLNFKDLYDEYIKSFKEHPPELDSIIKEYSYLNMYFIFKKYD